MVDTFEIAQSMWAYEDAMRRCTQKLFEWSDSQEVIARRIEFRRRLIEIALGLADENAFMIGIAGNAIAEEFKQLQSWNDYHDPKKGVEVMPDPGTAKKPWQ